VDDSGVTMPVTSLPGEEISVPLTYVSYSFERQLQDGDFLFKNLNIARTGFSATVVQAHIRADMGPNGGTAVLRIQDDPTSPSGLVDLNILDTAGSEVDQEFDAGGFGGATLINQLSFSVAGGRKLSARVVTARSLEGPGCLILGIQYA